MSSTSTAGESGPAPRTGRVNVNGVDLHYVESGSGPREGLPTVVALPGALGTAESDFGPQLRGLAGTAHVVSFDPRG
jgi:valacyclovir hydrolase